MAINLLLHEHGLDPYGQHCIHEKNYFKVENNGEFNYGAQTNHGNDGKKQ